ncbi:MAG: 4Fe-4S dicluster domain-containing protein [Byssovorax sp.]
MPQAPVSRRRFLLPWLTPEAAPAGGPPAHEDAPAPRAEPPTVPDTPPPRPASRTLAPLPVLPPPPPDRGGPTFVLRPPGARPDGELESICARCHECVSACPAEAIRPLPDGPGQGTPYIDPAESACVLCEGLVCAPACPSGALVPVASPREVQMGTAILEASLCTAYRGLPCRICYELCPVPGVIVMVKSGRGYVPAAGSEACVGCGVCQHHCPAPGALRVVPLCGAAPTPIEIMAPALVEGGAPRAR